MTIEKKVRNDNNLMPNYKLYSKFFKDMTYLKI